MIDNTGKTIIPESKQYATLKISGSAVRGNIGKNTYYFDKDGNEVVFSIK